MKTVSKRVTARVTARMAAAVCAALFISCSGGPSDGGANTGANSSATPNAGAASQIRPSKKATVASDYADVVQQLYIAYFGRPADPTGLVNFENQLLQDGAPTTIGELNAAYGTNEAIQTLINSFGTSAESAKLYANTSTETLVTAIFENVLGRAPASAGLNYWTNAIDNEGLTTANAALSIMAAAQTNTTAQGLIDNTLITNRIAAANNFVAALNAGNDVAAYKGAAAAAAARAMLAGVNSNTNLSTYQSTINATVTNLVQAAAGVDQSATYVQELINLSNQAASQGLQADTTFATQLYDVLSIVDNTPNGPQLLANYLNNVVLGASFNAAKSGTSPGASIIASIRAQKTKALPARRTKDIFTNITNSPTYQALEAFVKSVISQLATAGIPEPSATALSAADPQVAQTILLVDYQTQLANLCMPSAYSTSYCVQALQQMNDGDPAGALITAYTGAGQPLPPDLLAPATPACVYTYSAWGACLPSNTQLRDILSVNTAVCSGSPVLTQSCTYSPSSTVTYIGTGSETSTLTETDYAAAGLSCSPSTLVTTTTCTPYSIQLTLNADLSTAGTISGTVQFGATTCTVNVPSYSCTGSGGASFTIPAATSSSTLPAISSNISGTSTGSTLSFGSTQTAGCTETNNGSISTAAVTGTETVSDQDVVTCVIDGSTEVTTDTSTLTRQ